jgi:hypothetical protein
VRTQVPQFRCKRVARYALKIVSDYQVDALDPENFQRFTCISGRENSIACGFQNHFSERKFQFFIVNAENGRLGMHDAVSWQTSIAQETDARTGRGGEMCKRYLMLTRKRTLRCSLPYIIQGRWQI